MANDGYIEFLSPGALQELEKASNLVENLANQIWIQILKKTLPYSRILLLPMFG